MKAPVKVGDKVLWKWYWNRNTMGKVALMCKHNGKTVAKVFFKDVPEIPYYIHVKELKLA